MLATGALLVPIGVVLLGVAMRAATVFGPRLPWLAIGLGSVGAVGAAIASVAPGSTVLAASVLAIAVFHAIVGWRTASLTTTTAFAQVPS